METLLDRLRDDHGICAVTLGDGEAHGRGHAHSVTFMAEAPGAGLILASAK